MPVCVVGSCPEAGPGTNQRPFGRLEGAAHSSFTDSEDTRSPSPWRCSLQQPTQGIHYPNHPQRVLAAIRLQLISHPQTLRSAHLYLHALGDDKIASSGMFRQFFIGPTGPFWPDSPSLLTK